MLTARSLRAFRVQANAWLPGGRAEWGDDRKRYADRSLIQALAGTSPVPEDQRQVCSSPPTPCLPQAPAQCLAAIRLAEYAAGNLGQGLLRPQTPAGEKSQDGGSCLGQRLGAHHLCRVGEQDQLSD